MDVQSLITLGKLSRTITVGKVKFVLTTPTMKTVTQGMDRHDYMSEFVESIDGEPCDTIDKKKAIADIFRNMQAGVVAKVMDVINAMNEEQGGLVKEMFDEGK